MDGSPLGVRICLSLSLSWLALLSLLTPIPAATQSLDFKKFLKDNGVENSPQKTAIKLPNPFIGKDGRIYACSGKYLFAFESNGTVKWIVPLNYRCNVDLAPVEDERGKIYLIAEEKVLKINPSNIGASEPCVEIFFASISNIDGSGKIVGLSISISYSSLFITIKNRGLFAFFLHGQLMWSTGPMLYRFGYRQGCRKNVTECYFDSAPVVDLCEGTVYISNTEGQLYSLYIRSPNFRWIQDLSSVDKLMIITPGNNGRVYITFPRRALLMALDAYAGNILWQSTVGPLSKENSLPVIDSNGWISIGSLDGFLYSLSPTGELRKFSERTASDSVVQDSPILDCSGFAVYISQMMMESRTSHGIGNYTYISATNPKEVVVTLLSPATGTVYWTSKFPGELSNLFLKTDLSYFALDERLLLTFLAAARNGNTLSCYTKSQKLAWTCAQGEPKFIRVYTGDERAILYFVLFQFVILVVLAGCVRFCCILWRKKKLQNHGLGKFLEKRRSLHKKRKAFSNMISELEQKVTDDTTTSEVLEQLGEIVKAKEGVERKLSTSYSLGRDYIGSQRSATLPLYGGKNRSHSFHSARKESVTIFNTLSDDDTTSEGGTSNANISESGSGSSEGGEEHWQGCGDIVSPLQAKASTDEAGPSNWALNPGGPLEGPVFTNPVFTDPKIGVSRNDGEYMMESMQGSSSRRMRLKRRSLSSTN